MSLRHLGRAGGLLLAAVATVTMAAACGSSGTPAASSETPGGGGNGNGIQAYVSCLNQHGVKITLPSRGPGTGGVRPSGQPRPSRSPGEGGFGGGGFGGGGFGGGGLGGLFGGDASNPPTGVDQATWSAALTACKSLQPSFGSGGFGGGAGGNSAFTAYRNCLTSHGVTMSAGPRGFSTSNPKIAAALKTCAPLRPTGRPSAAASPAN